VGPDEVIVRSGVATVFGPSDTNARTVYVPARSGVNVGFTTLPLLNQTIAPGGMLTNCQFHESGAPSGSDDADASSCTIVWPGTAHAPLTIDAAAIGGRFIGSAGFTSTVELESAVAPLASVTVSTGVKPPEAVYEWVGFCAVELRPSPNAHA
jgi:hypothetical protein